MVLTLLTIEVLLHEALLISLKRLCHILFNDFFFSFKLSTHLLFQMGSKVLETRFGLTMKLFGRVLLTNKQVFHNTSTNDWFLLICTLYNTVKFIGTSTAVLLFVPSLAVSVLFGFGFERLWIILNRLHFLLLHTLRQLRVQFLIELFNPNEIHSLANPLLMISLECLPRPLQQLIILINVMLLLILLSLHCLFLLL